MSRFLRFINRGLDALFGSPEPIAPVEPPVLSDFYDIPEIVEVDIVMPVRGNYFTSSKRPRGLVVHFTAGRVGVGLEAGHSALLSLAIEGFACMVMDLNGVIYRGKNQTLRNTGWHAGNSMWLGQRNISRNCMGMEIMNEGKVSKKGKTWFNVLLPGSKIRYVDSKHNVVGGYYSKYTEAQERSLRDFCLWQMDTNPAFDIAWVVGHDEIAGDSKRPGYGRGKGIDHQRKNDPGGSFSKTMWEFREELLKIQGLCSD